MTGTAPLAVEWAESTGLFKGLPGNSSYLNGRNGGSFSGDESILKIFRKSLSP